jgi:outer membrane protein
METIVMKKMLVKSSVLACLLLSSFAFAELKIGVINVNKIFLESPQIAAADKDFKKKFDGRSKEITDLQKDFQKSVEAFNKNSTTMKDDVRKAEQQKIIDQQKKLQEMQTKFQNDTNSTREDTLKGFQKTLESAVSKVAKDKGFDLVVFKASLAYNKDNLEITDDVLKVIKK